MSLAARRAQGGFTLVEVLVAVTILSMVMLATVTGFRTLANSQRALERQTDRNDELRSVSSFLRAALESAVVGNDSGGLSVGGGLRERTVFETGPGQLLWKTTMLFGESEGGSYVVRVAAEGPRIVLRWQRPDARGILDPWNNAPARTLVEDLQSFTVAFRRDLGDPWQEIWDGRGPPGWVRLRVESRERFWPDMVMEVTR